MQLISGTNKEGYFHALKKAFLTAENMPTKWALTKIRQRISFSFFRDILNDQIESFEEKVRTYRGLKIYAVDGLQVHLPRTDDIVTAGYNGRAVSKYRESYTPRMYIVHGYNVLSSITKDLVESPLLNELAGALEMIEDFGEKSLTLYDRLYICRKVIKAHAKTNNFFLMRARKSSFKAIREYFKSSRKNSKTLMVDGVKLRMYKIKNPKTGQTDVFVTNLPWAYISHDEIQKLYNLRWAVETSFKDLCDTMKMEQWHSTKINGIRQELYCHFWLMNLARMQIQKCLKIQKVVLTYEYQKPNFKFILDEIKLRIHRILEGKRGVLSDMKILVKITMEKRKHYSRSYKREIKGPASPYPYNNTVWNIDGAIMA